MSASTGDAPKAGRPPQRPSRPVTPASAAEHYDKLRVSCRSPGARLLGRLTPSGEHLEAVSPHALSDSNIGPVAPEGDAPITAGSSRRGRNVLTAALRDFYYPPGRSASAIAPYQLVSDAGVVVEQGAGAYRGAAVELPAKFYDEKPLLQRESNRFDPAVRAECQRLWSSVRRWFGCRKLNKKQYMALFKEIMLVVRTELQPQTKKKKRKKAKMKPTKPPSTAFTRRVLELDWERDSQGSSWLTREMFFLALFQIADLWTATIHAAEYAEFLSRLVMAILGNQNRVERIIVGAAAHLQPKPVPTRRGSRRPAQAMPEPPEQPLSKRLFAQGYSSRPRPRPKSTVARPALQSEQSEQGQGQPGGRGISTAPTPWRTAGEKPAEAEAEQELAAVVSRTGSAEAQAPATKAGGGEAEKATSTSDSSASHKGQAAASVSHASLPLQWSHDEPDDSSLPRSSPELGTSFSTLRQTAPNLSRYTNSLPDSESATSAAGSSQGHSQREAGPGSASASRAAGVRATPGPWDHEQHPTASPHSSHRASPTLPAASSPGEVGILRGYPKTVLNERHREVLTSGAQVPHELAARNAADVRRSRQRQPDRLVVPQTARHQHRVAAIDAGTPLQREQADIVPLRLVDGPSVGGSLRVRSPRVAASTRRAGNGVRQPLRRDSVGAGRGGCRGKVSRARSPRVVSTNAKGTGGETRIAIMNGIAANTPRGVDYYSGGHGGGNYSGDPVMPWHARHFTAAGVRGCATSRLAITLRTPTAPAAATTGASRFQQQQQQQASYGSSILSEGDSFYSRGRAQHRLKWFKRALQPKVIHHSIGMSTTTSRGKASSGPETESIEWTNVGVGLVGSAATASGPARGESVEPGGDEGSEGDEEEEYLLQFNAATPQPALLHPSDFLMLSPRAR